MQQTSDPIVEAVRNKLLKRSQAGIRKYCTTLDSNPLTRLEWLRHAQEEALDLANYLEVLIQTEEGKRPGVDDVSRAFEQGKRTALSAIREAVNKRLGE